jgi:hypothetical protein
MEIIIGEEKYRPASSNSVFYDISSVCVGTAAKLVVNDEGRLPGITVCRDHDMHKSEQDGKAVPSLQILNGKDVGLAAACFSGSYLMRRDCPASARARIFRRLKE